MTVVTPELRPARPVPAPDFSGEAERVRVLRDYAIDSLQDDAELSSIARFAAKLCDAPIALVSLVEEERQRFLASEGLAATETPREISFCTHAMLHSTRSSPAIRSSSPPRAYASTPASRSSRKKSCPSARSA